MELILRDIALPLRHVFRIAHGETAVQESLLVELREGGVSGYGEGAPLPYYGVTAATIRQALEAARSRIESETLDDPAALWQRLLPVLGEQRFALLRLGRGGARPVGQAARPAGLPLVGPGTEEPSR